MARIDLDKLLNDIDTEMTTLLNDADTPLLRKNTMTILDRARETIVLLRSDHADYARRIEEEWGEKPESSF